MNRHQKQKSREIKDIMRTDKWGRMTYKEAKRKWKSGIRAFRVGDSYIWKAANLAALGYTREQMRDIGAAYEKVLKYAAERDLRFDCYYEAATNAYILRFKGVNGRGIHYGVSYAVGGYELRRMRGSLGQLTHRVLDEVNCRLQKFIFPPVAKKETVEIESWYPRIFIPDDPHALKPIPRELIGRRP